MLFVVLLLLLVLTAWLLLPIVLVSSGRYTAKQHVVGTLALAQAADSISEHPLDALLRESHPDLDLSPEAKLLVSTYLDHVAERISDQAASVCTSNELMATDVRTATIRVLPTELSKYAISRAVKAIAQMKDEKAKV